MFTGLPDKSEKHKSCAYSVAILCGGRGRRMGQDKAEMRVNGMRMADRLLDAFSGCGEILLSVRNEEQFPGVPLAGTGTTACVLPAEQGRLPGTSSVFRVTDPVPDAGPMAGLVAALRACRNDVLFVTAVDMPYMDSVFAEELLSGSARAALSGGWKWDVAIPADPDGRLHTLSAFYRKSTLPVLEECLYAGKNSIRKCFPECKVVQIPAGCMTDAGRKLLNLNYPGDIDMNGWNK